MTKQVEDKYKGADDVAVFHVQTVFEGAHTNTPGRGPVEAKKFDIEAPVGYDARIDGDRVSLIMRQYGTGGTPWTVVIDKKGVVRFNNFTPEDPATLISLIEKLRK